jgi:hypothetical protein
MGSGEVEQPKNDQRRGEPQDAFNRHAVPETETHSTPALHADTSLCSILHSSLSETLAM